MVRGDRAHRGLGAQVAQTDEVPGIQGQQSERDHLHGREACGQAHVQRALPSEVPVVASADDPRGEKENGVQIHHARGGAHGYQAKLAEHHSHQDCGE